MLIPGEDTWDKQAADAARTIRHVIGRCWINLGYDPWEEANARYGDLFVRYFSRGGPGYDGYAPLGAENDPQGLNKNHYLNLLSFYRQECQ